jgi:hypothetical protein
VRDSTTANDQRRKLEDVRERIAHLQRLLANRAAAGEAARAQLGHESTPPRRRQVIEFELLEVAADVAWIQADLEPLVSRERLLEADLAASMTADLERGGEAARAAKAAKIKGRAKQSGQAATMENASADASQKDPATTGA